MQIRQLLLTSMLGTLMACSGGTAMAQYQECDPATFQQKLQHDPGVLLDVRTPEECVSGVIAGARMLDFTTSDFKTELAKLDRKQPVFVYCAAGGRSYRASKQLQALGFERIYDLVGGMQAWREAGNPVVPPGKATKR
ncbi:MAG: rhodanese-like domain-containing protein [Flavobacteriales bacterium]|nr:rhodanese-like domain-containing protein [Flavobacteriales bacterium]